MEEFPRERIRNLSIIAHIDHGKSTLADRLLQMTGTLPDSSSPQFLDKLKVERERGITVKAQTVSIVHIHTNGQKYLINLIDTPGHVDFSYEVSRSLGACEGGLLLVDSSQGIQAQTLSVFHVAQESNLTLLPVLNKVDLPHASPDEVAGQIASSLGLPTSTHMRISAKSGLGVDDVLRRIVDDLPPPREWVALDGRLRGLVFDTFYDHFRGVVSLVRIFSGSIKKGDKVRFLQADRRYDVLEVGVYNPEEVPVDILKDGQVGYVVCNMKNSEEAFIGDTVCLADKPVDPLPGFKPMKAMVYAGIFPVDSGDFPKLEEAIERLTLNDRSVTVQRESSAALAQGFRLGFLGTLHMDVFRQRLEDEYDSNVIVTAPTVPYKVCFIDGREVFISNPAEFPDTTDSKTRVAHVEEPMVHATIFVPNDYIGEMMDLCARYRGTQLEYRVLDTTDRAILRYSFPLSEIVTDFFSELKSASSGFASFDYEEAGYEVSDLVKLNMLLNGKPVDALAMIVHKSAAQAVGRAWTKKLREVLPRQLFELAIQAAIGSRVVARETLSAMRKDVTAGLYGGHYERKLKHLNKQKEGKKRLKRLAGNIDIPQSAFFEVLSARPRAYSTMVERHAVDASFLPLLPDLPVEDVEESLPAVDPGHPTEPIRPHSLSPEKRSTLLSELHRLIDDRKSTPTQLHAAYLDLCLSSPYAHILTAEELRGLLRAMADPRRTDGAASQAEAENLSHVVEELQEVIGDGSTGLNGLELAVLMTTSRFRGNVSSNDLRIAEDKFRELFPAVPTSIDGLQEYARCLTRVLYLCALAGEDQRFEFWWDRLQEVNADQEDSWSIVVRVMMFQRSGQTESVVELVNASSHLDSASFTILLNFAIWSLALDGRFGAVAAAYESLRPSSHLPLKTEREQRIRIPSNSKPTRQTFGLLINGFAHAGDLESALTIMGDALEDGYTPGVPEYIALFRGFARHGEVPDVAAGEAAALFPVWEDNHTLASQGDVGTVDRRGRIESIWERGIFRRDPPAHLANKAENPWTRSALDSLFAGFMAVLPSTGLRAEKSASRAPSPKQVYKVLLAFARVTNGDPNVVRGAWEAMHRKFGEEGGGWRSWREDGRLRRIRRVLYPPQA